MKQDRQRVVAKRASVRVPLLETFPVRTGSIECLSTARSLLSKIWRVLQVQVRGTCGYIVKLHHESYYWYLHIRSSLVQHVWRREKDRTLFGDENENRRSLSNLLHHCFHERSYFWTVPIARSHEHAMKRLIVVGDSDIAFWPKDLLPFASNDAVGKDWGEPLVSGHSGATLAGVLPHLRTVLSEADDKGNTQPPPTSETRIVVACAGENDIGEGLSLDKSLEALREFLDAIFLDGGGANAN